VISDPRRIDFPDDPPPRPLRPGLGIALRKTFRDGYGARELRTDLLAGAVVAVMALPLSMALAVAVGAPPQHGLYTAIVAGALIAALGGSRVQVSGPTAAFVVVLAPITAQFGLGGLMLATMIAGLLLFVLGAAKMGQLIEFVPYPVTTGFTAGIGVVIATLQVRDFLGLQIDRMPESWIGRVSTLALALPTLRIEEAAIGVGTLLLLVLLPRWVKHLPPALIALPLAAVVALALATWAPEHAVETLRTRFHFVLDGVSGSGVPQVLPRPAPPWRFPGADGQPLVLTLGLLQALLPPAFTIAMLGAIESLLSAVVADGMIRRQHDPDAELMAQGIGNIVAPWFGGIAATGAIARTATNVRAGGRSPFASIAHSVYLLIVMVAAAPALGWLPMTSLAALLLVTAWRMAEPRHVVDTVRSAPRSDVLVLAVCFALTVFVDMVAAVTVGVMLAALLFMRRMAGLAKVELVAEPHRKINHVLPPEVVLYEISGPLFFGAAQRAMRALQTVDHGVRAVILDVRSVSALDATGLVQLASAVERLHDAGVAVVLAGVHGQPLRALLKAGWRDKDGVELAQSFDRGVEIAKQRADTK
jgi:SulP family sulfate permease